MYIYLYYQRHFEYELFTSDSANIHESIESTANTAETNSENEKLKKEKSVEELTRLNEREKAHKNNECKMQEPIPYAYVCNMNYFSSRFYLGI